MEFTLCTAGKDDEGKRLDRVLRAVFGGSENGVNIFQALRKKLIKVNGRKAEPSQRVSEGDRIEIARFLIAGAAAEGERQAFDSVPPSPASTPPAEIRLDILFQNDDLMFINKPAGISVQPSSGGKTSISQIVRAEWEAAGTHGSLSFIPAPLHRLDRYTSGILAISRSARGASWFSRAIQEREMRKLYLGICMGRLEEDALWEDRLAPDGEAGGSGFHMVQAAVTAEQDGSGGRTALTKATPLRSGRLGQQELTLVQYELLTGRKHQIRAQTALHGHPLYGDTAYGGGNAGRRPTGGSRFFLHAFALEFPPDNPLSLPERIEAPPPEAFAAFLQANFEGGNL
jgi:23S rRNA pseudouridine955/2504/2580 synthase